MGLGRGWACDGIQLNCSKTRPSGAAWGPVRRVGPSRAEQGRLGLGRGWACYKDRPSGAAWGRFGPSGA